MTCANVQEKMEKTWEHCIALYGAERCIALCHHGSYNYECALPDSDVDAKLMVVPSWDEIIHCAKPASETIGGPYGDINVTDVRLFIGNNLHKQNFNFIECLFTPYMCVNPAYADLWDVLIQNREAIAHYNPIGAVRTMMGQAENQYWRWDRFDNQKTLYHMMRIHWAIFNYVKGEPFSKGLVPGNRDLIMAVRLGEIDQSMMEIYFKSFYIDIQRLAPRAAEVIAQTEKAREVMESVQRNIIMRALYERSVE